MDGLDKAKYEADCIEAGNDEAKLKTLKVCNNVFLQDEARRWAVEEKSLCRN